METDEQIKTTTGQKKKRVIVSLLLVCLLLIALYGFYRWRNFQKSLDQEHSRLFYGEITCYTDKNDQGVYWIYLDCDVYNVRLSVSPETFIISEELQEKLDAREDNLPVRIVSIYLGRDQHNATKNEGRFTYPVYSIELWNK